MKKLSFLMVLLCNFAFGQDTLDYFNWVGEDGTYKSQTSIIIAPDGDNDGYIEISTCYEPIYLSINKVKKDRMGITYIIDDNEHKINTICLWDGDVFVFFTNKKGKNDSVMFYNKEK